MSNISLTFAGKTYSGFCRLKNGRQKAGGIVKNGRRERETYVEKDATILGRGNCKYDRKQLSGARCKRQKCDQRTNEKATR